MSQRLRWRVEHAGVQDLEVDLRPTTTVGDLAAALAGYLDGAPVDDGTGSPPVPSSGPSSRSPSAGRDHRAPAQLTLSHAGRALPTDAAAEEVAPPSGVTVAVVAVGEHEAAAAAVHLGQQTSPVQLDTCRGPTRLRYGRNVVTDGLVLEVRDQVVAVVDGTGTVLIDGEPVRGNQGIASGALLRRAEWSATLRIEAALHPPPPTGPTRPLPVSRGEWLDHEPEPLEVPPAPDRWRRPSMPWLTAMVPLLMAAGMWVATSSLMMVGFMGFSFVYVVASGIESRRDAARADRFAVEDFREDLTGREAELAERRGAEDRRDEMHHPAVGEVLAWVRPVSHRLWERSGQHPRPCVVRLGRMPRPPDDPAAGVARGRPELRGEVAAVLSHNDPRPRPATVDLIDTGGVALVGDEHLTMELARALVAQLAALTPPDVLAIHVHADPLRWRWTHWLPHRHGNGLLHLVVVERDHAGAPTGEGDGPLIWISPTTTGLPEHVRALVHFDDAGRATLQVDHGPAEEFSPETVSSIAAEATARALCSLVPGSDPSDCAGDAGLPHTVDLSEVGIGLEVPHVLAGWATPRAGLAVPLGAVAGGGVLSVDLVADGPHALVAGTTGAGKSELLRSLLAGLAALHPPTRVNMLLVDYKGGAAFGPLADLPHCVGLVTDLGAGEVRRTLTALRAELRRRETVLDLHGASDLDELDDAARPPSLLVVVDEFATLVAEVPDFLDGVLDVAQRGRSLGIHLVLATQRPSGVISDAVRANTSLRIALRLPDAQDSDDVIDSPVAASLPRSAAGRAVVRLGHDTLVTTQVAWSGGPAVRSRELRVRPLGEPEPEPVGGADGTGPTQLQALVEAAATAAAELGLPAPMAPLPPPLPARLETAPILPLGSSGGGGTPCLAVGVVDLPQHQRRDPLVVDPLGRGGVLVLGTARSGVSSTLVSLAGVVDRQGGWDVHAIDAAATPAGPHTGGLGALAVIGSVRSVVSAGDHESVHRLLRPLTEEPVGRPTLVIVDGFAAFEQQQRGVNRGAAVELLERLATEGRSRGVAVAISARRRAEMPPALLHALAERIVHRVVDEDEAAMCDAPPELADRELPPGRAWFAGNWAQVVAPPAPVDAQLPPTPKLPRRVVHADLVSTPGARWRVPLGIEADRLEVAHVDLSRSHLVVAGPPRSGRTTTLRTIATAAARNGVHILLGHDAAQVLDTLASVGRAADPHPTLGVLDDLDDVLDDDGVEDLLGEVLQSARRSPVRIAAAGDALRLQRAYSDAVTRLRSGRSGVLLGVRAHERGDLLHVELRSRDDLPPAVGRGWVVGDHDPRVVQVALPDGPPSST